MPQKISFTEALAFLQTKATRAIRSDGATGHRIGMRHIIDLHPKMERQEWFRLRGAAIGCDACVTTFSIPRPCTSPAALRGCFAHSIFSASWTDDEGIAASYAVSHWQSGLHPENGLPLLAEGTVAKRNVLGLKHFVAEDGYPYSEIITFAVDLTSVSVLLAGHDRSITKQAVAGYTSSCVTCHK